MSARETFRRVRSLSPLAETLTERFEARLRAGRLDPEWERDLTADECADLDVIEIRQRYEVQRNAS